MGSWLRTCPLCPPCRCLRCPLRLLHPGTPSLRPRLRPLLRQVDKRQELLLAVYLLEVLCYTLTQTYSVPFRMSSDINELVGIKRITYNCVFLSCEILLMINTSSPKTKKTAVFFLFIFTFLFKILSIIGNNLSTNVINTGRWTLLLILAATTVADTVTLLVDVQALAIPACKLERPSQPSPTWQLFFSSPS